MRHVHVHMSPTVFIYGCMPAQVNGASDRDKVPALTQLNLSIAETKSQQGNERDLQTDFLCRKCLGRGTFQRAWELHLGGWVGKASLGTWVRQLCILGTVHLQRRSLFRVQSQDTSAPRLRAYSASAWYGRQVLTSRLKNKKREEVKSRGPTACKEVKVFPQTPPLLASTFQRATVGASGPLGASEDPSCLTPELNPPEWKLWKQTGKQGSCRQ